MTARFVVGLDGSDHAQLALEWAARLAAHHSATIRPVLVWDAPTSAMVSHPVETAPTRLEVLESEYQNAAAALVGEVAAAYPDVAIERPMVQRGEAGHELCRVAADADLLVVGSRGLGGFASLVLGSVSGHCAAHAPCPVAVIPASYVPDGPIAGAYVVGVDGSARSQEALAWADQWAPADTSLRLVHAWEVPVTIDRLSSWTDPEVCQSAAQQIADEAAATVRRHRARAVAIRTDARSDLPVLASDADALVIGARGRRGIARALLGSVSSSALHHLTVPTIIVR